jgi:hypothetical protein
VPDTLTTISFTAPQSLLELYTQAACFIYSYKPILPDGTANPQTPAQFAMRHIIDHCSEVAQAYAAKQADAARVSAIQADSDPGGHGEYHDGGDAIDNPGLVRTQHGTQGSSRSH